MPRAVIADELGPISNYAVRAYDPGPPGSGQVRIALEAAGVSFVDVLVSEGRYQAVPPTPFVPGSECAGRVEAVGEGVDGVSVGQKVIAIAWGGVFAEKVLAPASSVWPMPQGLSFEEAAVLSSSSTTAWYALVDRGELKRGETLLVLGAGGSTGVAAVQLGRHLGARVIASASSEAKRALALAVGAHAAVDTGSPGWRDEVKAANGGKPLDVVFDPVGGEATERAFRCLGYKGRHLVVGFPGGLTRLPTNLPLLKSASLVGVNVQGLIDCEPERMASNSAKILALAAAGVFRPQIARTYPLEQFAQAMADAAKGEAPGRIVLVP
jgi:NADPH2:quinone reductase